MKSIIVQLHVEIFYVQESLNLKVLFSIGSFQNFFSSFLSCFTINLLVNVGPFYSLSILMSNSIYVYLVDI